MFSPAGSVGASAYFRMQRSPPETRTIIRPPKSDEIFGTTQGSFPTSVGAIHESPEQG